MLTRTDLAASSLVEEEKEYFDHLTERAADRRLTA